MGVIITLSYSNTMAVLPSALLCRCRIFFKVNRVDIYFPDEAVVLLLRLIPKLPLLFWVFVPSVIGDLRISSVLQSNICCLNLRSHCNQSNLLGHSLLRHNRLHHKYRYQNHQWEDALT